MAIPADIAKALHGAWRLARFDRAGLAFFGHDEAAFIRSFGAAVIIYPAFLVLLALRLSDTEWQDHYRRIRKSRDARRPSEGGGEGKGRR